MSLAPSRRFTISREAINALPLVRYTGPVTVAASPEEVAAACDALADEALLGFDTETRPSFRPGEVHPVALLQLAAAERVYLFRMQAIRDPAPVLALLESPSIVKAGVAIGDDLRALRRSFDFHPNACVELGRLPRDIELHKTGLRSLCAMFLGQRLPKSGSTTNWSRADLTDSQIVYAATDAWICRRLYLHWKAGGRPLHGEFEAEAAAEEP